MRKELDLLSVRTAIMLAVTSHCWPGYVSPPRPGEDTWFLPDSVWLLVWGPTAGLHFPEDFEVVELRNILRPLLWFGSLGLSFQAEQIPQPPPPLRICIPSRCVMCRGNLVAALIRCAGCGTPRYCSTKCRKADTVHWAACGHVGLEGRAESADVLSRGLSGDWALLPT